jgi:S-adenosylmethionine synthetase
VRTSESVRAGHPDKVADLVADRALDEILRQDPRGRVAVEVLVKGRLVVVAGEVTSSAHVDYTLLARQVMSELGYPAGRDGLSGHELAVLEMVGEQAPDIATGVFRQELSELGAGDQGVMIGYATAETPELMPLPALLAHRITRTLDEEVGSGRAAWLRPDGKAQVSVEYEVGTPVRVTDVVVSAQHREDIAPAQVRKWVMEQLLPAALREWHNGEVHVRVNPTGRFVQGGPAADCGLTGRKVIVDTYGGACRHGGGAFSGKDPTKVDRSAAYFARYVARQVVKAGLAEQAEVEVAYAIGVAEPVALSVDCFGTGDEREVLEFARGFDFRPGAIIERLELRRPIYAGTTNYGHFGREGLPWER